MGYSVCAFGAVLLLAICTVQCSRHGFRRYRDDSYERSDSRESSESRESDESPEEEGDDTIYRFGVGGNYGPYEYLDDTGRLSGFNRDLIIAVCAKARKKCTWVPAPYSDCWAGPSEDGGSLEYPGIGLLASYYDACMGWAPTPQRYNAFNFSISHCKSKEMALFYKNDAEGDLQDLTGKKVGFVTGWLWNEKCLARQTNLKGNQVGEYTVIQYSNNHERAAALRNGEIDTAPGVKSHVDTNDIENWVIAVDLPVPCESDGEAVMARYSRMDLINWWNDAFEEMRATGEFRRFCERAERNHGHRGVINCAI